MPTSRRHSVTRASRLGVRRGVAVVLVLALLAMTLALSYAVLRSQVAEDQVQLNDDRRATARHKPPRGPRRVL